jgi:integrase
LPTHEQFLAILKHVDSIRFGRTKRCADLIRFLAFGGFRISEAKRVLWEDCDFQKKLIQVKGEPDTGTKNWEPRNLEMIPDMKALLERLYAERPDAKPTDRVMLVSECQGALNSGCKAAGSKRITHHDLRDLFATRCLESGVPVPTVAKWLGHKDGGALLLKTYSHVRQQHAADMAKLVSFAAPVKAIP